MYKPVIDKIISQRAYKFAQREYMDFQERDALSKGYYWGYKDAEKDLALTWQDIAKIDQIMLDLSNAYATGDFDYELGTDGFYQETLKRFNEYKEK